MKRTVQRAIAATVIGLGVTGGVVMAQAPTTTPATGTATTNQPSGNGPQVPGGPNGPGRPGGPGPNGAGPGQDGGGRGQMQTPTTASVTTEIGNLTKQLTSVKADRDFATGKMDLATVNSLIDKATALQTQAQTALTANNLTQASGYVHAAEGTLRSADDLIVASIGTTGLPSAANRPARPANANATTPTADQQKARSSNELARSYQSIVKATNDVKANSAAAGDAGFYITTAQGLYKQAYDLYNAGKYDQASQTVRAADGVANVAESLLRAAGVAPAGPTVVTVPAPTF